MFSKHQVFILTYTEVWCLCSPHKHKQTEPYWHIHTHTHTHTVVLVDISWVWCNWTFITYPSPYNPYTISAKMSTLSSLYTNFEPAEGLWDRGVFRLDKKGSMNYQNICRPYENFRHKKSLSAFFTRKESNPTFSDREMSPFIHMNYLKPWSTIAKGVPR